MDNKPLILVSNDDGYDSPGILELAGRMNEIGDVIIAAPDRQMSAVSSALSVAKPLRVRKMELNGFDVYSLNGTPTDTVKIAVSELLDRKPDLVVSGINHGANTSINVLYSGTVAAAIEGMLLGIPSIAFSIASHDYSTDLKFAGKYSLEIAKSVLESPPPDGTLLNVNFPTGVINGLKATKLSSAKWKDIYEKRTDPFKRDYYWFAGEYVLPQSSEESTDDITLKNGYASVSPLKFDFNDIYYLEKLEKFNIFTNG